jgi:antitoxin (DNA-binding transcriptional repressor) of toxin-antitoxin stability system
MSETVLTIEEAARCLSDLVERIHANGEAAVLVKSGRPLARIVPVPSQGHIAADLIAFLRRWRIEHPEPDEQFAPAIEKSRRAVQPPRNTGDDL